MNHTWFVLQHVEWEGPGLIAEEATARGLSLETCRLDLGMTLPDATGVGGLIAMGGPMGVYESERYPFLDEECRLIREMVDDGRPVLGVCLGAQLLAHALGGRVFPGPSPEIGLGPVRLTDGGKQDPVLGPAGDSFSAFHWHGDTFDLPATRNFWLPAQSTRTKRFARAGVPMACNFTSNRISRHGQRGRATCPKLIWCRVSPINGSLNAEAGESLHDFSTLRCNNAKTVKSTKEVNLSDSVLTPARVQE